MSGNQKSPIQQTIKRSNADARYTLPLDDNEEEQQPINNSEKSTIQQVSSAGQKNKEAARSMGVTQVSDQYAIEQIANVGLTINKINNGVTDGSYSSRRGSKSPREIGSTSKS